jgi:hypothetical protein
VACGLILEALSRRIGYSPQYISDVELAKGPVSRRFAVVVDRALEAGGQIVALHPAVVIEREIERQKRADARREVLPSSPCSLFGELTAEDTKSRPVADRRATLDHARHGPDDLTY